MNSIRLATALALAISTGALARSAGAMPDQIQCTDGTIATKAGRGACSHHGGIARTTQSAPTTGAANRALPPTERAPDNAASQSPWSIFGGKRKDTAPAQTPAPAAQGRSAAQLSRHQSDVPASTQPTAKCRDGSASYSAHHSGSCSHHGGVAQWLDAR